MCTFTTTQPHFTSQKKKREIIVIVGCLKARLPSARFSQGLSYRRLFCRTSPHMRIAKMSLFHTMLIQW
jgi:hypothetical protein